MLDRDVSNLDKLDVMNREITTCSRTQFEIVRGFSKVAWASSDVYQAVCLSA
jgi:hypothetical protein